MFLINSLNGGFFTSSFLESFNFAMNRVNEFPSWQDILTDTQDLTFETSNQYYLSRRITSTQTPVFEIKLENLPIPPKTEKKKDDKISFSDGEYLGEILNNKRHGMGLFQFKNGGNFVGEFKNDVIDGSGVFFWNPNKYYVGSWTDGKRDGFGIQINEDGNYSCQYWEDEVYIGRNPVIERPKYIRYSNGYFLGEVENGKPNGKGKYVWNNGNVFEGFWINGVINGSGLLTFSNNQGVFIGYWENGQRKCCYGIECLSNGNKIIGIWKNETYRGKGLISHILGSDR